ncbi:hypothetical protein HPB50_012408 [Hyalomma asiaticum]|uniref:Uncharacterized protein n=1 Tax=Hyalomma asiaticum TaxID=266040 RepID=A0ACB7SY99_HYAAI|nr:hypothetical protein HPB50_012408 [Hyalomma asiaticum]
MCRLYPRLQLSELKEHRPVETAMATIRRYDHSANNVEDVLTQTTATAATLGQAQQRCVVNGIGHEITPDDFLTEVEVPGYEVLTCRRLGDSGAMVLTFCGKRVPFFVNAYGQALRCYLYKRTIPHCRKCNKTGHREDMCPQPPDTEMSSVRGFTIT